MFIHAEGYLGLRPMRINIFFLCVFFFNVSIYRVHLCVCLCVCMCTFVSVKIAKLDV